MSCSALCSVSSPCLHLENSSKKVACTKARFDFFHCISFFFFFNKKKYFGFSYISSEILSWQSSVKMRMYFAVSKLHVTLAVSVYVIYLRKRLNWCLFIITIAFEISVVCLA